MAKIWAGRIAGHACSSAARGRPPGAPKMGQSRGSSLTGIVIVGASGMHHQCRASGKHHAICSLVVPSRGGRVTARQGRCVSTSAAVQHEQGRHELCKPRRRRNRVARLPCCPPGSSPRELSNRHRHPTPTQPYPCPAMPLHCAAACSTVQAAHVGAPTAHWQDFFLPHTHTSCHLLLITSIESRLQ